MLRGVDIMNRYVKAGVREGFGGMLACLIGPKQIASIMTKPMSDNDVIIGRAERERLPAMRSDLSCPSVPEQDRSGGGRGLR